LDEKIVEFSSKWKQFIDLYGKDKAISNLYQSKIFNPYSQNTRLKNLKTKPARYTRSQIENMLANPASNEQQLRSASWYYYNNITPINKQVNLYADILTYRWWLQPHSAKIEKTESFNKHYERAVEMVNSLNPKKAFREIVLDVMREGKVAYCVRKNGNKIYLQRMPSDYVKIVYRTEVGWQMAFNMMYFSTEGASVDYFPPIFKDLYQDFSNVVNTKTGEVLRGAKIPSDVIIGKNRGSFYYWQEIPVDVGIVFSFDDTIPDVIPPLSAQFIDASDLDSYKMLQQELLQIPLNQILTATVPLSKDNKSGSYSDDTAITPELCLIYEQAIRDSLPANIDFVAAPFENFNLFSFDDSISRNNVVGNAIQNFYNESLGGLINTSDKPSMSAITTQQKIETRLIDKIYEQFKLFVNNQFSVNNIDFIKFKIDGNVFTDQNKLDSIRKEITSGNAALYFELLSFYDYDFISFMNGMDIIDKSGLYEKLKVPPTSFTTAGASGGTGAGRPSKPIEEMTSDGSIASAERELNTSVGRGLKS
jgi:hypothetical protein